MMTGMSDTVLHDALHKSREVISVALPFSTDTVNPAVKASKFVRLDLPTLVTTNHIIFIFHVP